MLRQLFGKRARARSLLTLVAVGVGVFSVAVTFAAGSAGRALICGSLDKMGINSVLVESRGGTLDDSDVDILSEIEGVNGAMPLMSGMGSCRLIGRDMPCMIWGVSRSADRIISLTAIHGRLIDENDISAAAAVCVIDREIALETYGRTDIVGKTLAVDALCAELEIVGVADSGLSAVRSAISDAVPYFIYLPYTTVQNFYGRSDYDRIALLLDENRRDVQTAKLIEAELEARRGGAVTLNNLLSQRQQLEDILSVITDVLTAISCVSLTVAAISVMTAMLSGVNERRREIGIKKCLGAGNLRIVAEFMAQSVTLTLIGAAAGVAAGLAVCFAADSFVGGGTVPLTQTVALPLAVSLLIGVISGSYPAYKAARLKPAETSQD